MSSAKQKAQEPIRVVIDISAIPFGRGVSRYTSNLATALASDPLIDLSLFGYNRAQKNELQSWAESLVQKDHTTVYAVPPQAMDLAWRTVGFPLPNWNVAKPNVVHAWEWQVPRKVSGPMVVTLHDLAYKLFPETAHPEVVSRFDSLLQWLEEHTQVQIIAVSEATKRDIINLTSIDADRISVVHEALPQEACYVPSKSEQETVLKNLRLEKPFFLTIGTTEPRKNLKRVIAAWKSQWQHSHDLVIVGAAGWDTFIHESGMHILGYQPNEAVASLYRQATALLFPSLYEGFGLPILEAYFHGCPVVTSAVSSMPEVAGEAAELVDPYSEEAIAEGIQKVANLSAADLTKKRKKMQQVLSQFSWEKAAAETREVYLKALHG